MRRKETALRSMGALFLSAVLALNASGICLAAQGEENQKEDTALQGDVLDENILEIGDVEGFLDFAEQCAFDLWSMGKTVSLTADIDLAETEFYGIPYFSGVFDGNGHHISGLQIQVKGSEYGLFRYIGETALVKDIKVSGSIVPTGSQENIGGIVGVNYGTIENCSFSGSVNGQKNVGAIAGSNEVNGKIIGCESSGIVLATDYTGGIAGKNEGLISGCTSKCGINMEELETTLDLGGIDVGSLNLTQNVVTRNNTGGIAGYSSGLITHCRNEGTIGYRHTGYNVGGIAGSQRGIILLSINEGEVYGRKDVGGIVGQALPYIESEYLDEKIEQTQKDINRLNQTVNNISYTMQKTSQEVNQYTKSLSNQYENSYGGLADNLDELSEAVATEHPEAKSYVDNIAAALDIIDGIQSSGERLTQAQLAEIQKQLGIINDNLSALRKVYEGSGESAEELVDRLTTELKAQEDRQKEVRELADSVNANVQSISNNLTSASNQISRMADAMSEDFAILSGKEEVIEDISSAETAENMDGVVSECINRGNVDGDLNVGGITGTMNVEYEGDPEFDVDLSGDTDVRLRSTANNVITRSVNYGQIHAKKNCAGGITGLQELGFLYDCEGYGDVSSDSGSYLGGIAGNSKGTVQKSYSLCNITGTDYVGGICGSGYTMLENISIPAVDAGGERIGSIAGKAEDEGTVKDNYFVGGQARGIDGINYAGMAEEKTYDEVLAMEQIPQGFHQVKISFEADGQVISEKQIPYGSGIKTADFRLSPKEGSYIQWPEEESIKKIYGNKTITAEYIPWTESVAGDKKAENGKTLFLAVGEFYEDTVLEMEATDGTGALTENASLAYAYSWKLQSERKKEIASVTGHMLLPDTDGEIHFWIKNDGNWVETEFRVDGSYLVAELPYSADFAVTVAPQEHSGYYYSIGIAGGIILLILIIVIIKVKKRKRKSMAEPAG